MLEAEAEAKRTRAAAEAETARTRAAADAETARTRAAAEAEAKRAEVVRRLTPLVVGFSAAALLAVDFYRHESSGYIRRRMLAQLRSCRIPETAANATLLSSQALPVAQAPLVLGLLPTMLLGPTGCGKSTLLAKLARDSAAGSVSKPTPTVFVRLRLPASQAQLPQGTASDKSSTSLAEAYKLMDSVAAQVYRPIGFPPRRALVYNVPHTIRNVTLQLATSLDIKLDLSSPSSHRVCDALRLLFDVLEQLCHERVRDGIARDQAAPVLLLDEVQDLVKTSRLKDVGGRAVFETLAQLLVMYCVDRRVVRAAVAGSSAALSVEFDRTVASGSRWRYYELHDPEEGAMLDALRARGYTADEAAQLVKLCGTRLRLLEPALAQGAALASARDLLTSSASMAERHFDDLFRQLQGDDKSLIFRVLDQAAAAETSEAAEASTKVAPPKLSAPGMSDALLALASKVLYLRLNGSIVFQSQLHRTVWQHVRGQFVPAADGGADL